MENVEEYVQKLNEIHGNENRSYSFTTGKRFYKVTVKSYKSVSVHSFVDKSTGDVFKAASWSAPAAHVRGNISNNNIADYATEYGAVYL